MSDQDIHGVSTKANLSVSDLEHLFLQLGMSRLDIDNIKHNAGNEPVDIQADRVLKEWRQRRGGNATRQAIISALEACNRIEASEALSKLWGMKTKGTANYYVIN